MKYFVFVVLAVFASVLVASALPAVQYPAGTTSAQKAVHEGQRAKAAKFQAKLARNPNCVEMSCDRDGQVRLNVLRDTPFAGY